MYNKNKVKTKTVEDFQLFPSNSKSLNITPISTLNNSYDLIKPNDNDKKSCRNSFSLNTIDDMIANDDMRVDNSSEVLALLFTVYPDIDTDTISNLYTIYNNNVDLTLETLFSINDSNTINIGGNKSPKSNLREIMDEEFARSLSDEKNDHVLAPIKSTTTKSTSKKSDTFAVKTKKQPLSTELNLQLTQLCNLFPNFTRDIIYNIFQISGFDFSTAVSLLEELNLSNLEIDRLDYEVPPNSNYEDDSSKCVDSIEELIEAMLNNRNVILPECSQYGNFREMASAHTSRLRRNDNASILVLDKLRLIKTAHEKAALTIFYNTNRHRNITYECDLHGLFVTESTRAIKTIFSYVKNRNQYSIITGVGNNSENGAKVKPAILNLLRGAGKNYTDNGGKIVVYLK